MTITVAMPYRGAPEYVRQAVQSVLAQTERNLRLVVIADGEQPPLAGIRDSRLEVYALPESHGTYFAHQLILSATPDAWYAPHDADDWTEPDHLERLLACGVPAVGMGSIWLHINGTAKVYRGMAERQAVFHVGLFATERLRSIGGYNPAERIGQDTIVLRLLSRTGPYVRFAPDHPTYHRRKHPGSLTTSPFTNHRSEERRMMKRRNRLVVEATAGRSLAEIRIYRESIIPPQVRDELAHHVERLSSRMGKAVAA